VPNTSYLAPGVYLSKEQTPLIVQQGVTNDVVAIVGPGVGYRVFTEALVLTGTTPVALSQLGVNLSVGFQVRNAAGTPYQTLDYTLVQSPVNLAGSQDDPTTIARTSGGGIVDGSVVYITYRYTDALYNQPFLVSDYETVKHVFGEPLDLVTGYILSPLSLAAKIAMENGAITLVLVHAGAPSSVVAADLANGMARLGSQPSVSIVVPLPVGLNGSDGSPGSTATVGGNLASHVDLASTVDHIYQVGILGYETGVTVNPTTLASGVGDARVMVVWPQKMLYYDGFSQTTLTLGGYYLAAAVAGRMASLNPQDPMTRKQIRSFSGISADTLAASTVALKNAWSASGVAVAEYDRNQRIIIRHGVSTDVSSKTTQEMSLTRIDDAMMRLISTVVEGSGLIGASLDAETPTRVKGVISGGLETLIGNGTILSYSGLLVRQSSTDPTVIEVKFQYLPAYPVNFINVLFTVNASTGAVLTA